jgi:hypothetical protein
MERKIQNCPDLHLVINFEIKSTNMVKRVNACPTIFALESTPEVNFEQWYEANACRLDD